jgi:hypothetical protein
MTTWIPAKFANFGGKTGKKVAITTPSLKIA